MIAHKNTLETLLSGSRLSIEKADEWADHWEIPFDFGPSVANVTDTHWQAFRDLGLCLTEQRDGVEGIAYYVSLPKTYTRWRHWPMWQITLMAACTAGSVGFALVIGLRMFRFLTP